MPAKATKATKPTKPTKPTKATKPTKPTKPTKATKPKAKLRKRGYAYAPLRGGKVFLSKGKLKWRPSSYLSGISDAELRHYGLGPSKWY